MYHHFWIITWKKRLTSSAQWSQGINKRTEQWNYYYPSLCAEATSVVFFGATGKKINVLLNISVGACEEGRGGGGCWLDRLNLVRPGSPCNYGVFLGMHPTLSLPCVVMVPDACICREDYGQCSVVSDWTCVARCALFFMMRSLDQSPHG